MKTILSLPRPRSCLVCDALLELEDHIAREQPLVRGRAVIEGRRDGVRITDLPIMPNLGTNA